MVTISFNITEKSYLLLSQLAAKYGMSRGKTAQKLIEEGLARYFPEEDIENTTVYKKAKDTVPKPVKIKLRETL